VSEQVLPFSLERAMTVLETVQNTDLETVEIDDLVKQLIPAFMGYIIRAIIIEPGHKVYRARVCSKPNFKCDLSYPPVHCVDKLQRVNKINEPVFYSSTLKESAIFEVMPSVGDYVAVSEWETTAKLVVNHVGYHSEHFEELKSNRTCPDYHEIASADRQRLESHIFSSHFSKVFTEKVRPGEEYRYKLSIALANKLKGDVFDALMYPTVAMRANADNLAITTNYADSYLKLNRAEFLQVTAVNEFSFDVNNMDIATHFSQSGEILWEGRPGHWVIREPFGSLKFIAENGSWRAYDKTGNPVALE
jgi:hypothetical protein